MRQLNSLQGEIADLEREIMDLKTSADASPDVLCHWMPVWARASGIYSINFLPGDNEIMTECLSEDATITIMSPEKRYTSPDVYIETQNIMVKAQSECALIIMSNRGFRNIDKPDIQPPYPLGG